MKTHFSIGMKHFRTSSSLSDVHTHRDTQLEGIISTYAKTQPNLVFAHNTMDQKMSAKNIMAPPINLLSFCELFSCVCDTLYNTDPCWPRPAWPAHLEVQVCCCDSELQVLHPLQGADVRLQGFGHLRPGLTQDLQHRTALLLLTLEHRV